MAGMRSPELQSRDIAILEGLLESRLLTIKQISAMFFEGRMEATFKRLQKLKAGKFIQEYPRLPQQAAILRLGAEGLSVLEAEGILHDYPPLSKKDHLKRLVVSEITQKHEVDVQEVKAAFHAGFRNHPTFTLKEFSTWPARFKFRAGPTAFGLERELRPDGFIRIHEKEPDGGISEHCLFLEVDQTTEKLETLVEKIGCYHHFFQTGGFALRNGGKRDLYHEYPFRVLMVFKSSKRLNNFQDRLQKQRISGFRIAILQEFKTLISEPLQAVVV